MSNDSYTFLVCNIFLDNYLIHVAEVKEGGREGVVNMVNTDFVWELTKLHVLKLTLK